MNGDLNTDQALNIPLCCTAITTRVFQHRKILVNPFCFVDIYLPTLKVYPIKIAISSSLSTGSRHKQLVQVAGKTVQAITSYSKTGEDARQN